MHFYYSKGFNCEAPSFFLGRSHCTPEPDLFSHIGAHSSCWRPCLSAMSGRPFGTLGARCDDPSHCEIDETTGRYVIRSNSELVVKCEDCSKAKADRKAARRAAQAAKEAAQAGNDTYDIRYEDGVTEQGVASEFIRKDQEGGGGGKAKKVYAKGESVEAREAELLRARRQRQDARRKTEAAARADIIETMHEHRRSWAYVHLFQFAGVSLQRHPGGAPPPHLPPRPRPPGFTRRALCIHCWPLVSSPRNRATVNSMRPRLSRERASNLGWGSPSVAESRTSRRVPIGNTHLSLI